MSSTSNVQNLLVNVVRPTYKWEAGTGFVPSVVVSNVTELIAGKVKTSTLVVSDSNVNTFIGSNAGCNATTSSSNVGIGYSAMGGVVNADSNVAIGTLALDGFSNGSNNTVIGAGADITANGDSNIIIGTNTQITSGSNSIVIGNGITWSTGNSINIKNSIYGSNGSIGIGTVVPAQPLDVSGLAYFRDKVGIQVLNPTYSLDVLGTAYATTRFLTGPGSDSTTPAYSFCNVPTTGLYQTSDASYGSGALGVSILGTPRVVVSATKTYIYGDLDVCGAFSAVSGGGGGGGGTIAANGSASAPSFTFTNDLSTGLHLNNTSSIGFDTSGIQRMCLSGGFLGIGTANPGVTLEVVGDVSATTYNGPGGTQSAPHYTFSDDRTTGVFFPGANMVGFTAGGTERMRISNSAIGIGTKAPTNALDVSGTLRVIGTAGDITFTNGAIAIGGSTVVSSTGVLSNSFGTSNSIGGVVLDNSNVLASTFESSPSTANTIGGVRLSDSNIYVGDGLVGVPSIAFSNETNTGLYRGGPNSIGVAVTGTQTADFSYDFIMFKPAGTNTLMLSNGQTQVFNGSAAAPSLTFANDTASGLYRVNTGQVGFATGGIQRMIISNANVGIGTATPGYTLDVCGSAGSPSLNVRTWPRTPLSNCLLVKGVPASTTIVANTLNFNTVVRTINSTLATFVASNTSDGASLFINKAGIWSIMLVGSTGNGTQLWMDVSTNNHSNIDVYTNGNPVLAVAYTPGTGTSNNTTCSFMGFVPSNVYVKPRLNGSLGGDLDRVWRFNAIFHSETDEVTTWPF